MPELLDTAPAASVAADTGVSGTSISGASPTSDVDTSIGTPDEGVETADTGAESPDGATETGTEDGQGKTEVSADGQDGRVIPAKWRELFTKDRELKDLFFAAKTWTKTFPGGIPEARRLKQTLDLAGGEKGLQDLQTDVSDFREVANQFMNGDPKFVDDLASEDPIAFGLHVPRVLEKFKEVDTPGYNREISRRIAAEHEQAGLRPALETVYQNIKDGKTNEALALLTKMADWHDRIEGIAKQEDDPRVKELQGKILKDRQTRDSESLQQLNTAYQAEAGTQIDKAADRILDSYLKGKNYDDSDRKLLKNSIIKTANEAILKDKEYTEQRDRLFRRRDKDASVRFAVSRWEKELTSTISQFMRTLSKGAAKPNTSTNGKTNGNIRTASPGASDGFRAVRERPMKIDKFKTTSEMLKQKRAILPDGSKVTWVGVE